MTGLRRRECGSLKWTDVDFASGVIRLSATRTRAKRKFDVPITTLLKAILMEANEGGREEYVFPSYTKGGGTEWHVKEARFALNAIEKETGIKATAHDLRRTFATVAEAVFSFAELKAPLNHAIDDRDVTLRYARVDPKRAAEAAERVADKFRELCDIPAPRIGARVTAIRGRR